MSTFISSRWCRLNRVRAIKARMLLEWLEDRTLLDVGASDSLLLVGPNVNISRLPGNQTETTIAINPTNPQNLFASETLTDMARYSMDGGSTWTDSNLSAIPSSIGDVQAAWDNFGNLFLTRFGPNLSAIVARSSDGGATFKDPRTVVGANSDQPSIAVGLSGVDGIAGSVWISVTNASNQIVAAGAPVFGFDSVGPFTAPQVAPGPGGDFGSIAIGPSGQVMVDYQNNGSGAGPDTVKENLDPDGLGPAGFGAVVIPTSTNVGGFAPIPAQPNRTIDAEANLAWDRSGGPHNGRVYLVYTDRPSVGSVDTDIFVRFSDDDGVTWSPRVRVNDDASGRSQFLPAIALDQTTGDVAVTWYDARNDDGTIGGGFQNTTPNDEVQVFGSVSLDGGDSFLSNVQISTGVISGPAAGGFNLGDYDTMDFFGGVFYRSWADNSVGPGALGDNPGPGRATDVATARVVVATPAGPFVTSFSPSGMVLPPVDHLQVTFDRPIDVATFTTADIVSFTDPAGVNIRGLVTSIDVVPGSDDRRFTITLAQPLTRTGSYSITIGPDILDTAGNPMDQNVNGTPGEVPEDEFTTTFGILGPRIIASTPANNARLLPPLGTVRVTFNEPINAATFTTDDVRLTGPNGVNLSSLVTGVTPVAGTNGTQFDVAVGPLTAVGIYTVMVGPDILDLFDNPMDQDNNLVPGEPGDVFTTSFGILGPRVIASSPTNTFGPVDHVRLTFNEPMDVSTFTTADVVSFTGPNGVNLRSTVTGVTAVAGTNGTQFDITFVSLPQTALGTYSLVIGPDIRDLFGNLMDQNNNLVPGEVPGDRYTATFTIVSTTIGPDAFGYTGTVSPFEDINLEAGQPGVFTILTFADDSFAPVNLGSNTFTFYGATYTGNNQLFVSSNALITFGSGNADLSNSNLTTTPPQAAIAPLWDDWVKLSGSPMILGRFDDLDGDGTPDRLIIEWNDVQHFPSTPSGATFQVILQLNTGRVVPGGIVFNYPDLIVGNPAYDNGASATVGIKDAGTQGPNRLLVSFNSTSPFVGSGQAIRFSAPPFGGAIHGQVFNDLDRNGMNDPSDPALAGWTIYLDLNTNGQLDPGEPSTVSDANGNYGFTGLVPGIYFVREMPQPGWVQTSPLVNVVPLSNGGFETGNFSDWTTIGSTSIRTATFGTGPTEGTYQALITNGSGSVSAATLETFLGLTSGSLNGLGNGPVTNGSAIRRTFSAPAGAVLTFDWNFLTNESPGTSFNDFAFVSLVPSSPGSLSTLGSTFSSLVTAPGSTGYARMTGFHTFTFVIPASGDYTLGIGVVNVGDTTVTSAVLVDNVQLSGGDFYAINLGARQVVTGRDFGNYFEGDGGDGGDGGLVNPSIVAAAAMAPPDQPGRPSIAPARGLPAQTISLADAGSASAPPRALPTSAVASGDLVDRAIADEVLLDGLDLPTWSRLRRRAGSSKSVNVLA